MKSYFRRMRRTALALLAVGAVALINVRAGEALPESAPPPLDQKLIALLTIDNYAPFVFRRAAALTGATDFNAPDKPIVPETLVAGAASTRVQGYAWDIVNEALRAQGYTIILKVARWDVLIRLLKRGAAPENYDDSRKQSDYIFHLRWGMDSDLLVANVQGNSGNIELAQLAFPVEKEGFGDDFLYSAEPLFTSPLVVYASAKNPPADITPAGLARHTVGFVKGADYAGLRQQYAASNIVELDDIGAGFRLLRNGRLTALFGYEPVFDYELRAGRMTALFVKKKLSATAAEYLCVHKTAPDAEKLIADFDAGFRAITANGKIRQLTEKWQKHLTN
ncbi:hypothetical protein FACS1894139_07210 [Planctomycetales bacterium]|nr:hypothetical protein FACS1894107_11780 [Planctomycetales bacterium]GHT00875.1 hypothetical protein FACS1894108_13920 [Planctomycetales bacterium]GHT04676.1 hypothetical protein FACS1894139_07210 [Planctomycetales bacterium]